MLLQFWFEFASTYSYPAAMRIERRAHAQGVQLAWNAFLLGPIFREQGWNDSPFNVYPAKGRYMWRDVERLCETEGLPFRRPSQFPRNGLLAARVACRFALEPWMPDFVRSVYHANFAEDQDISAPAVIGACLNSLRQDADAVLQAAGADDAKALLRVQTERAVGLGIFGAPSFMAGKELFWGNDRLEQALSWSQSLGQST